ncbi:MAG: hypothetical protein E6J31_13425 [Chloroflexi bacterium]|nr:MAG: hypothetical protein E6J36_08835 [Chloroflexota bacterium]TMC36997.1 MAG: hypothetical protein E6J31_13425 [Chloroflexota bacterium]TMC98643.1 MAG: hypothetical protein E6J11_08760 [Chloroflexota bacterium]
MSEPNTRYIFDAITPIVEALEHLGVNYHIGGSVASSIYGIIRATIDADLVANLELKHVRPLVKLLEADYYIDEDSVRDAVKRRGSFNAIYLDTMLKVDVFIPKSRLFDQEELRRIQLQPLIEGFRPFYVASPEGTILNKLEWYRMGGEVSDRQWNDILGVLKVQGTNLDMAYLQRWAVALKVSDLLERALVDAGLSESK